MFGGIDYYIAEKQLNDVEEIKTHYLSEMKLSGVFSNRIKNDIQVELQNKGLTDIQIHATDGYDNRLDSNDIIFRNADDVKASTIKLYIKAKPKTEPFIIGKLLVEGKEDESGEFYFFRKGRTVSERPNY